ncbi:MAG: glycoside hydrolase 5 family protein [Armatimonadota bacterium]
MPQAATRRVFSIAPNGRYFLDPHGAGYHPVGINSMEELLMQHGVEARYWADHEVEAHFRRLAGVGGNYLRLQTTDKLEDTWFTEGHYEPETVRRMDLIMDLAEEYGIAVNIEVFCPHHYSAWYWRNQMENWRKNPYNADNGGPIRYAPLPGADPGSDEEIYRRYRLAYDVTIEASMAAQKARLRWFMERYGGRRSVFCFGLSNDFPYTLLPEAESWLRVMSAYARSVNTFGHLLGLQTFSGAEWPEWMVEAVDFTCVRAYPWSVRVQKDMNVDERFMNNPLNLAYWLHKKSHEHLVYGKPAINGEYGAKSYDWTTGTEGFRVTPDMDRCTLYGLWASLASGSSAGHRWCGWDGFFVPTETAWGYIGAVARFCKRIDWARFDSRPCDEEVIVEGGEAMVYALRDERLLLAWVANTDPTCEQPIQPSLKIAAPLPAGRYELQWIDAETNATLSREVVEGFPLTTTAPQRFRTCAVVLIERL